MSSTPPIGQPETWWSTSAQSARILDPCRGLGAFTDHIPGAEWCEITEGRDFFDWHEPVDWVISNPPYSLTRPWFRHSYTVARYLCYLVPLRNVFSGYGFLREIHEFGGIREIRTYGTGGRLGFPMGNAVGAFHIERGYSGPTEFTFYDANEDMERGRWGVEFATEVVEHLEAAARADGLVTTPAHSAERAPVTEDARLQSDDKAGSAS